MQPLKVFLVDDHEIVRQGLRSLIEAEEDLHVIGEASTADEALLQIQATLPDVAVLDVRLPDGNGIEVCREIRSTTPSVNCLMLTSFSDDEALFSAVLAGASGYLLKQIRGTQLVDSIRIAGKGESLIDPELKTRAIKRADEKTQNDPLAELTRQERTILDHIAQGKTNRQIAQEMYLAEKTVKNYVSNLLAKLGMSRRTEAAAYAARLEERRERNSNANP